MSGTFAAVGDGVTLSGEDAGEGVPVLLAHGLTATRRYVVHGSRTLERSGHRVVAYDARAHGTSSRAPQPDDYGYDSLAADMEAVLDDRGLDRAVLAGASMGAHTIVHLALRRPRRVAGMVLVTPAYSGPEELADEERMARWDALADGLRERGVEGFVAAYGEPDVPPAWRDTVVRVIRQRLSAHDDLDALADALAATPRSAPFQTLDELGALDIPAIVVGSRDEADPGHPLAVAESYARALPGARLVVEDEGESPIAWQGGRLSRVIAELAAAAGG